MASKETRPLFETRLIKEDDIYGKEGYTLNLLRPDVYQFESKTAGCHVYLILGDTFNVLIDSGLVSKFDSFNYLLTTEIGLTIEDINLIINTHAHFDHISTNCFFDCFVAAHRNAATKIQNADELIIKAKKHNIDLNDFRVHIWLDNQNVFDLGNIKLEIIETPGHTSGGISIYEPDDRFMFTGDTLFNGALTNVYESGSISELINSLKTLHALKINYVFPAHGKPIIGKEKVNEQIHLAIHNAEKNLQEFIDRVHRKPEGEKIRIPPSLYNREEQDL